MNLETQLMQRSGSACELCSATSPLQVHNVSPSNGSIDQAIFICDACAAQMNESNNPNHWHCLKDAIWSPTPAVQVMAYRLLKAIANEQRWAQDLLETVYLDPEIQAWADAETESIANIIVKDSNGALLNAGDSVTLIKDLDVKGAGFTAKRGTVVKNITLTDNPEHIEGRVNGMKIVLKTCFLKKA